VTLAPEMKSLADLLCRIAVRELDRDKHNAEKMMPRRLAGTSGASEVRHDSSKNSRAFNGHN
jgi:hypothetical protein